MAISFLTGQRLTADLLNANVIDFMPLTFAKAATTARSSTTTPSDDPELSAIPLAIGTYDIEFRGNFTLAVAGGVGIKTKWGFTGTAADANRQCYGAGEASTATNPGAQTSSNFRARPWLSQEALYGAGVSAAHSVFRETVSEFVVTVAGNFSIQWAQQASSANAVSLMASSAVIIRKVR